MPISQAAQDLEAPAIDAFLALLQNGTQQSLSGKDSSKDWLLGVRGHESHCFGDTLGLCLGTGCPLIAVATQIANVLLGSRDFGFPSLTQREVDSVICLNIAGHQRDGLSPFLPHQRARAGHVASCQRVWLWQATPTKEQL